MPEFFLELFSEEIPARMQARAADDLCRLLTEALAPLAPAELCGFHGARRIAACATVAAGVAETRLVERGPRRTAPEQALAGFLRKHGATKDQLREEGDFWVLDRMSPGVTAGALIASVLPGLLRRFPWPKSMRWGGTSQFTWVRPLRRITCILDGAVVPFDISDGADDGHGLAASNLSEGHRFHAPDAFAVTSCAQWAEELMGRHVVVDAAERRRMIAEGLRDLAATSGLTVVEDPGLLDEVSGLVEWPVPLMGAIDPAFMDLPPEVMQVSMRVNQRYSALRDPIGRPAPFFAFVANIRAPDGGHAIIAGNERVLRARFADARHFWDLDRKATLASRVAALDGITFHAKLGTQGERAARIARLAGAMAEFLGADIDHANRAGMLAKADLTTGVVGEFPELQGIMGGYYARHDGEELCVADAIRDHYAPRGPNDELPDGPLGVCVALADKLDSLAGFFGIGERPTGSGDPYALRRAALGIIRIIKEKRLEISLRMIIGVAAQLQKNSPDVQDVLIFLFDRLRHQLRAEGARHDVLNSVLGTEVTFFDDLNRIVERVEKISEFLASDDGVNLLAAYRRAANILRIEEKKDGPHDGAVDVSLLQEPEEQALAAALRHTDLTAAVAGAQGRFADAMASLAKLRGPIDAFFEAILVNAERPELRQNRLRLLFHLRAAMNMAADFSRIEG